MRLLPLWTLALAACTDPSDKVADTDTDTDIVDTDSGDDGHTDVLVADEAPSTPVVAIAPDAPTVATGLQATVTTASVDPEGEEVTYRWKWTVDGVVRDDLDEPTVPAGVAHRDEVWVVAATPSDGQHQGEAGTASVTIGNATPTLALAWANPTPNADDDLRVSATADDADRDLLTLTYAWTKNGGTTAFLTANVPSAYTSPGELWHVTVTAADSDGATATATLDVTIVDRAPIVHALAITPDPASPGGALTAQLDVSDPDRDTLTTTWAWSRDGAATIYTTATVPGGVTVAGETWTVTATVDDGHGGVVTETADVSVVNQAPTLTVGLPDTASPGDTLEATVDALDVDGDTLAFTYVWTVDDVVAPAYTTATLPADVTSHGEIWALTVTVSDGHNDVVTATAETEIVDETPVMWSATISPAQPTDADPLTATWLATDEEGDTLTPTFVWLVDNVVSAYTTSTVPAAATTPGEVWRVRISVSDGTTTSGSLPSAPVTIQP